MKKKIIAAVICILVVAAIVVGAVWKFSSPDESSGTDGENMLYADSVGLLTGTGLGAQNRFSGLVEAKNTIKSNWNLIRP